MNKKYDYMQIGIASPDEIRSWSHGEVNKPETINYRTLKPERGGLFCEVIFGPTKDYQCGCGKVKITTEKGKVCDKCGVELTESKVRRERMGHINLYAPVVHTWYLKNTPSKIATLLDKKTKEIEDITYLASCVVTDSGKVGNILPKNTIISLQDASRYERTFGLGSFKYQSGAEAIKTLLKEVDLQALNDELRQKLKKASKQQKEKLIKRLEVVESFLESGNKPEWMVMDCIPVLPPDLRPMVQLDGGRFATTDLNDLYRFIIMKNLRLKKELDQRAPELIVRNEKRILQEAVDALIDNGKKKKAVVVNNRPLKSLSDLLRGKQGRFRQNLLGKRVDYSGRSVIAVGPDLKMYQCGLPREMALILFKPFVMHELVNKSINADGSGRISPKRAKEMIEEMHPDALEQVEKVIVEHPVLLNRAPTLHRLGIQAFEPKLVEGKAIRLHPLVCSAFNADFDGDQMAVHVPLSEEAQAEARLLMLASKNILAPKDGKPIVTPSQDMILGNYYLTIEDVHDPRNGRIFKTPDEAELAYENDQISLHTRIILPAKSLDNKKFTEKQNNAYILTTYGKIIFNTMFPKHVLNVETGREYEDIPYVNEADKKNLTKGTNDRFFIYPETFKENGVSDINGWLNLWYDETMLIDAQDAIAPIIENNPEVKEFVKGNHDYHEIYDFMKKFDKDVDENNVRMAYDKKFLLPHPFAKGFLKSIITVVFREFKLAETSKVLDKMKDLGFYYSTISGITVSIYDIENVSTKQAALDKADKQIAELDDFLNLGLLTAKEKREKAISIWNATKKGLENDIANEMKRHYIDNHLYLMGDSGARGSVENYVQLSGMRGLMGKPNGESMDIPIRASFREGLTMSDFFNSSHGSRKGCTDTALKTAESGYLTRRLVDVSQEVVVREDDCGTDRGIYVSALKDNDGKEVDTLFDRINGRFTAKPVYDPNSGELIIDANEFISDTFAQKIVDAGIESVCIRTLLTCRCKNGVCVKCYGSDLSTGDIVEKGEVVGIIAAQSIGEPGTQLTMRTFHTGGVAGGEDITQGLPRIQELFEAREPKGKATISGIDGTVESCEMFDNHRYKVRIRQTSNPTEDPVTYETDSGKTPIVSVGDVVKAGQKLTEGFIHPKELLKYTTEEDVASYILHEVQKVYGSQGVGINDKHVEIIIKQMLQKVVVIDEGDTNLLPGTYISKSEFNDKIVESIMAGKKPPVVKPLLLGITRASLKSDSYLSAASFQETTRVLTEAAIRGKRDPLEGLKENIIIGGLIPAGTGIANVTEENLVINDNSDED